MFWKMGWNVMDFCIVGALLLGPCKFLFSLKLKTITLNSSKTETLSW